MKDYELGERIESVVETLIARGVKENPDVMVEVNGQLIALTGIVEIQNFDTTKPVIVLKAESVNVFQLTQMGIRH